MFQKNLFQWKSHLTNRFFYKKYFYWVSCFKIGFYDDNVDLIKRSHVKNVINQSIHQITIVLKITIKQF